MDDPGSDPGPDAREALERLLLDGPRRYTRLQVAELSGMPPERTQRLWRALGFPDAADDDPAFTDADVEALGVLSTLIDSGFVDPDDRGLDRPGDGAVAVPAGRLADRHARRRRWPAPRAGRRAGAGLPGRGRRGRAGAAAAAAPGPGLRLAPAPRRQRRPAAAPPAGARATAASSPSGSPTWSATPRAAAGMGGRELGAMVEDFESIAAEVIARHHGRVVKTVGDGVLFTADAAVDAVEIGLRAARGLGRRGAAAAAGGRRLRRGAHPARRRLLAGGEPGQPADLASPARAPCWSTGSWPHRLRGPAGVPGAAAAAGVGARLRPPAAVAGARRRPGRRRPRTRAAYDEDAFDRGVTRRRPSPPDRGRLGTLAP